MYREVSFYRRAVQYLDYEVNVQAEQLSGYSVGHTGRQYLDSQVGIQAGSTWIVSWAYTIQAGSTWIVR